MGKCSLRALAATGKTEGTSFFTPWTIKYLIFTLSAKFHLECSPAMYFFGLIAKAGVRCCEWCIECLVPSHSVLGTSFSG